MMDHHNFVSFLCVLTLLHASHSLRLPAAAVSENDQWEVNREFLVSEENSDLLLEYENTFKVDDEGSANGLTDNLCMSGHLVPEFFLLGAMKTSTTTLAHSLYTSKSMYFPANKKYWNDNGSHGRGTIKELHFFSQKVSLEDKDSWLNYYPKCSFKRRVVATDCTPAYIRTNHTAKLISDFYGALKSKLVFGLMLREPLARAQSAFYHQKSHPGRIPETMTFNQFTKAHLKDKFDTKEIMWGSQYPKQLEKYFEEFESAQFWIVPFRYNTDPQKFGITTSFTETLWNELGVSSGNFDRNRHSNIHQHSEVDKDLDMNILKDAMNKFSSIAPDMAKLLASSNAKLFGYTGKVGDEVAINKWLTDGW